MEKEMTINRETKSLLAKLMASENIHVEYSANASTAMFDTEGRTLIMPILKDITESATDLFLGHEVGHALYTPQGAIKEVVKKGSHFKNLVNIVEDARIEKMIQNKFPGLKRSFYNGYSDLIKSKFFDLESNDVADMNFMDRLNIHFKVGIRAGVQFTAEEMPFVNRIEKLKTFDETLSVSDDLFDYIKDNADPDEEEDDLFGNPDPESGENGNNDMGDVESNSGGSAESGDNETDSENSEEDDSRQGKNGSGSETEEDSEKDAKGGTSGSSDEDSDEKDQSGLESGEAGGDGDEVNTTGEGSDSNSGMLPSLSSNQESDLTSKTQESFEKGIEEHLEDSEFSVYNATVPNIDPSLVIVPMEKVHEKISTGHPNGPTLIREANEKWMRFRSENKSLISYMAKEFEMRKSADEHKRTRVAKTGILNPNKLHAFKFSEDLFLRNSVVSEGKNHGFVMFVDWSGSMHNNMKHTIDQLTLLAMFCKKINIPFDVYAFTSCWKDPDRDDYDKEGLFGDWVKPNDVVITNNFDLLHLVSSTLSTAKFNTSMSYLRWLREGMTNTYYEPTNFNLPPSLRLGGTPLNECIIAAMPIVDMLRKKNNVQIINTVFLTDGQGHSLSKQWVRTAEDDADYIVPQNANGTELRTKTFTSYGYRTKAFLTDSVTKKVYEPDGKRHTTETGMLLKMLKDRSDARVAGFFIAHHNRKSLYGDVQWMDTENYSLVDNIADDFKKQGWSSVDNDEIGYDKFFVLSDKFLNIKSEEFEAPTKNGVVSKGRLKNAFIKSRKGKIGNKTMLSKFAEFVS